jgi:hypothetical protein
MSRLLLFLMALVSFVTQTASIHIGSINLPFALPSGVIGLQCVDAAGVPKNSFTGHGDTAFCTLTLGAPAPATGFVLSGPNPPNAYAADNPLVLNPPAASGLTVPAGNVTWKFTVSYP